MFEIFSSIRLEFFLKKTLILASEKTVRFPEIAVFFRILPHCVSLCDLCVCVKLQPCSSYLIVKNRNRVTMNDLTNHVSSSPTADFYIFHTTVWFCDGGGHLGVNRGC